MTTTTGTPELSCYSTTLVEYLERTGRAPDARRDLAYAVRPAVRTDLPGIIPFAQHAPVDRFPVLAYADAPGWDQARRALRACIAAHGAVIAVANSRCLPWSPHVTDVPHWIVVAAGSGGWLVTDPFAALLPAGAQDPWSGPMDDAQLRAALTPMPGLGPEHVQREIHALGPAVRLPPLGHYRWLDDAGRPDPRPPDDGRWLDTTAEVLAFLGERLSADPDLLTRHADDVWAAARHQCHRIRVLVADGSAPPAVAEAVIGSWSALPRALRFAEQSAARGRSRPGTVTAAFDEAARADRTLADALAEVTHHVNTGQERTA